MMAQIHRRRDGAAALRFPYRADFVAQLKAAIPAGCRSYDPDTKTWTVFPPCVETAVALMRAAFGWCEEVGASTDAPTSVREIDPTFAELHLLNSAPAALIRAAYRVLAKECHPDAGGDTRRMQQINAAYAELCERGAA